MIAYSRYEPHRSVIARLAAGVGRPLTVFRSDEELAVAAGPEVRDRRERGEPLVIWEAWPSRVQEAWGELTARDLVLSNGFFPHYSTVSWDRRSWVAEAEWVRSPLDPLCEKESSVLASWTRSYRRQLANPGVRLPPSPRPFFLVVLQIESDLVARWWEEGRGNDWLVSQAAEAARRSGATLLVKQHPFDPKSPEDYTAFRRAAEGDIRFVSKDSVPLRAMGAINAQLLSDATEVWGLNSTMLLESALLYGKPTRAFAPTLMDGHGVLATESPFKHALLPDRRLPGDQARWALLRRVLSRQVDSSELDQRRVAECVLGDRAIPRPWAGSQLARFGTSPRCHGS